ncbi:class I SAM-dependent methyltransferase [candidate division CSSED10-310 bacterium]|uniref:Class I SAM-dependent methyltransferase n=1 Tax=candidate division CSSED10-310 bacterium TaxID=2855610 RepID=A0ABV6Z1X6_UNCC1
MHVPPTGAGKSSFDLIDAGKLFTRLELQNNSIFLDLGCGQGKYTMAVAPLIQENGRIFAYDLWEQGITELQQNIVNHAISNIVASVVDVSQKLPLESESIDVCLMATVFHDLVQDGVHERTLNEVSRTLKKTGQLVIVEFKKIDRPPGPPFHVRISPDELERMMKHSGFQLTETTDIGPFNYVSLFAFSLSAGISR